MAISMVIANNFMYNMYMKLCATCKIEKEDSSFFKNGKSPDGLAYKCAECLKEYMVTWRAKNKVRMQKQQQKYLEKNRDRIREYNKKWHQDNRDKVALRQVVYREENPGYFKEWKKENADKVRHYAKKRRTFKQDIEWAFYKTIDIYNKDNGICGICKESVDLNIKHPNPLSPSVDHIKPLIKGGRDIVENLQIAHLGCNLRKGATYVEND